MEEGRARPACAASAQYSEAFEPMYDSSDTAARASAARCAARMRSRAASSSPTSITQCANSCTCGGGRAEEAARCSADAVEKRGGGGGGDATEVQRRCSGDLAHQDALVSVQVP